MEGCVDTILGDIGGFGIYQWITTALANISNLTAVWGYLMMTYAGQTPPIVCENYSSNADFIDEAGNYSDVDLYLLAANSTSTTLSYGTNKMATIVSEWNLVCTREWIPPAIYTVLLIGSCVGGPIFGAIGDVFGRKPGVLISSVLLIVLHIASAYSPSCLVYGILQFFLGICASGYMISYLNGILENSPSKWHPVVVGFPICPIAACLFAIAAWAVHDWRSLHIISAVISAPLLLFCWFFQESVRWLDANGQYDRFGKAVTFIAKANCSEPPSGEYTFNARTRMSSGLKYRFVISEFIANKDNMTTIVCLVFVWFSIGFGYYGMSLGVTSLSDNLYLNMFLLNVVDIPAAFIATLLLYRFGRNCLNVVFLFASGSACVVVGFLQSCPEHVPVNQETVTGVGLVAKALVGLCVVLRTIYSLELVPTSTRSTVYGILLLATDIGGCLSPLVIQLDLKIRGILYFLTGSLLVSSSGMMLLLRETRYTGLGDVVTLETRHTGLGDVVVDKIIKPDTYTSLHTSNHK